jgi:hypothetical protein
MPPNQRLANNWVVPFERVVSWTPLYFQEHHDNEILANHLTLVVFHRMHELSWLGVVVPKECNDQRSWEDNASWYLCVGFPLPRVGVQIGEQQ